MFKGGLGDFFQQAQKMRGQMQQLQETLAKRTVEASSGAGMVKVVANGKQEIVSITIDPEVLERKDRAMLEDLVTAGVNQAIAASREMVTEEMSRLTGDLGPLSNLMKGMQ